MGDLIIMKFVQIISSFLWNAQIFLIVGGLLLWFPNDTKALFGYLASFVFTSLAVCVVLFLFRSRLRPAELLLPLIIFSGIIFLFIKYFYMSGRTEMYVLGIYAMGFTILETIRFLYKNNSFSEKFHLFPHSSHCVASIFSLGIWFFIVDFLSGLSEESVLKSILVTYILIGTSIVFFQTCEKYNIISEKKLKRFFMYIFVSVFFATLLSLFSSFVLYQQQNTKF